MTTTSPRNSTGFVGWANTAGSELTAESLAIVQLSLFITTSSARRCCFHEACGVPEVTLKNAKRVALSAGRSFGSQCAAIRRIVPWEMIERLLRGATPE